MSKNNLENKQELEDNIDNTSQESIIDNNVLEDEVEKDVLKKEELKVSLEDQIAKLQEESSINLAGWKRAQADYQNLQKTSSKEKLDIIKYASSDMITKLIPLFDNFELALKYTPEELKDNQWVKGIEFILKQMQEMLIDQGVKIINPLGEDFDPHQHEAVETIESEDESNKNKVIEVMQVGYKLEDKLIRSARVRVSS